MLRAQINGKRFVLKTLYFLLSLRFSLAVQTRECPADLLWQLIPIFPSNACYRGGCRCLCSILGYVILCCTLPRGEACFIIYLSLASTMIIRNLPTHLVARVWVCIYLMKRAYRPSLKCPETRIVRDQKEAARLNHALAREAFEVMWFRR